MKKCTAVLATAALMLSLAACGGTDAGNTAPDANPVVDSAADNNAAATDTNVTDNNANDQNGATDDSMEGVITYAEYAAADVDTEVTVITYVQDKQGWWENDGVGNATFYTQDHDGGYFLYISRPVSLSVSMAMVIAMSGWLRLPSADWMSKSLAQRFLSTISMLRA